jgi:L-threonylcarbamoyladenylate synthase
MATPLLHGLRSATKPDETLLHTAPLSSWHLRLAAHRLRHGAIIAYPTESVYGLGCDPLNGDAVARLLSLKRRRMEKGVILISDSFDRLRPFVGDLPSATLREVLSQWPGAVTWLLPAAEGVPPWLTGNHETLAMRVTAHPVAAALCRAAGMPLISTSANLSGHPPARNPLQVRLRCGDAIDLLIHGQTGGLARPTPIRDALSGKYVRE